MGRNYLYQNYINKNKHCCPLELFFIKKSMNAHFHTLLSAISIVLIRARCHQIDEKDNKKNPDEHGTFKDAA